MQYGELSSLSLLYRDIRRMPRLSAEEELRLGHAWFYQQNMDAAKRLVEGNMYAVAAIAREYRHFGLPEPDLIQEGVLGLMQAVKRFDPEKGCRLMTYASWWIHASIHDFILNSWSIVKIGTNKLQRKVFAGLRKAKHAIAALEGRGLDAVSAEYGISAQEYQKIAQSYLQRDVSLDASYDEDGEAMVGSLPGLEATPEECVMQRNLEQHQQQALYRAMQALPERDRYVLRQRHLSDEPATLQVLSDELGVSIERVRQIEARAMKKMREHMVA